MAGEEAVRCLDDNLHRKAYQYKTTTFSQSGEDIFDDVPMNVGEPSLKAIVIERQSFMVQSHQVQQSCIEVINSGFVHRCLEPKLVALSITEA